MPKKEEFVLKDSDPEFIKAAGVQPRGREYDAACAKKPGAIRIDDVLLGTKLACIAITDDNEETLAKVGKMNPWHIEALKMITGSEEEAHKPLTHILDKHFNLKCDKILDLTGWSGGRPIDTQGYIAHNDEIIVVTRVGHSRVPNSIGDFDSLSTAIIAVGNAGSNVVTVHALSCSKAVSSAHYSFFIQNGTTAKVASS